MPQDLINWALGIAGTMGMWWIKTIWDSHKELAAAVSDIKVLVAGHYVRRDELTGFMIRIEQKLDSVNIKLDSKQDKNQ